MTTHPDLMAALEEQFRPVFAASPDGVYLWLDEGNKICNERLAAMFGYSVAEWRKSSSFLETFVAADDQELYGWHYRQRVAALAYPVTFRFRGVRKDRSTFAAETEMIPISYAGHAVAYHFVRQISE